MILKTAKRKSTFRETSSVQSVTNEKFTTINQYIMIRKLGSGSYGSVYLCKDKESSEEFAIKIIKRSKLKNVNGFKAQEMAILKSLVHTNIVKLHEIIDDKTSQCLYLVMDYLPGGTLAELL